MKSLLSQEDNEQTAVDSDSGSSSSRIVKLDSGRNALWILSPNYEYGYVHWVQFEDGKRKPIVCAGGPDGKGWQPDECMLCDFIKSKYAEARDTDNKREAEGIKNYANRMSAKFEIVFIAAKGEMLREKTKINGKTKIVNVPAFDTDELEIGLLRLSNAQYRNMMKLVSDDAFPYIRSEKDLLNRAIIFDKRKRGKDNFETVECRPGSKKPMKMPGDIEWDADDFNLESMFEIDTEAIEESVAELSGGSEDIDDEEFYDDEDVDVDDDDDDFEDDDL